METINTLNCFNSLIKMMYWISQKTNKHLTKNQLEHCLMRNFGGTDNVYEIVEVFLNKVPKHLLQKEQSTVDSDDVSYS